MSDETPVTTSIEQGTVRVRRAPRFAPFIVLGIVAGAVVALILTLAFPVDPAVGFGGTFGYFVLIGVALGALVGAAVVLVLDAISRRRAASGTAEVTSVDPAPIDGELED
jgi:hypothetical protein